jgi:hypothetical protein
MAVITFVTLMNRPPGTKYEIYVGMAENNNFEEAYWNRRSQIHMRTCGKYIVNPVGLLPCD